MCSIPSRWWDRRSAVRLDLMMTPELPPWPSGVRADASRESARSRNFRRTPYACRESGMRYHPFSRFLNRAQIEPFRAAERVSSTLISTLMHCISRRGCRRLRDDEHKMWRRIGRWLYIVWPWSSIQLLINHPIAHSAAVPPKFEHSANGIRALEGAIGLKLAVGRAQRQFSRISSNCLARDLPSDPLAGVAPDRA